MTDPLCQDRGRMNTQNDQMGHLEMVTQMQGAQPDITTEALRTQSHEDEIRHELCEGSRKPNAEKERNVARETGETNESAGLLRELRDVMKRYVVLPEMAAEALAL